MLQSLVVWKLKSKTREIHFEVFRSSRQAATEGMYAQFPSFPI